MQKKYYYNVRNESGTYRPDKSGNYIKVGGQYRATTDKPLTRREYGPGVVVGLFVAVLVFACGVLAYVATQEAREARAISAEFRTRLDYIESQLEHEKELRRQLTEQWLTDNDRNIQLFEILGKRTDLTK